MDRIFFGFLMIILINKPASSFDIFGINIEDIKMVYKYVENFYAKTEELRESPMLQIQDETIALHDIMNDMKGLSQQLIHIETNEDIKLDNILKVLLDSIEVDSDLRSVKLELLKHIDHVEYLYERSEVYNLNGSFSNETLKGFTTSVLSGDNNLLETVYKIFQLIFPRSNSLLRSSFQTLSLSYTRANYDRLCDRGVSEQQRMYYIFMVIIHTHLKAFTTIIQAYSFRFTFAGSQYSDEYKSINPMFHSELTEYFKEFVRIIRYFPNDIRRCDPSNAKMGHDILEFTGLFQVAVNSEAEFRKKLLIQTKSLNYAAGRCEDIESRKREQIVVYNCKTTNSIKGCPVENSNKIVRFSWWKTDAETFGHSYECPNSLLEVIGENAGWSYNDVCVCSVNYTSEPLTIYNLDKGYHMELGLPKIMSISIEPQMSDVANNMVVVGVKFIVHDNAIHLQIKQSKLSDGSIPTDSVWKPVDVDNNNKTIPIRYGILFDRRNIMNLDDVGIDPKYVVTGVRFQLSEEGNGYELHVHGTEYIHEASRLGGSHMWCKPGEYPINQSEYQGKRTEIHLNDPDDPSMTNDYHSDQGANKFVQFQHSSVQKDGGYHTVPFFDAQPVTATMDSPLGGIGLFYRGHDGFGGYIAPRLFTLNSILILESSIRKWEEFDNIYRYCHGEFNVTVPKDAACLQSGIDTKKMRSETGTSVNIGLSAVPNNDSTTFISRDISRDDSAGVSPGHSVADHVTTTKSSSLAVDFSTNTGPRRPTSNHSSNIAAFQSTGDHSTNKSLSLTDDSLTRTESSRVISDNSGNVVISQSTGDHYTTKPSSLAGNSSATSGLQRVTSNHPVPSATFHSAGVNSTAIKRRNRSRIHKKQRKRKIEAPLKVLRRKKSSIIYLCNTDEYRTQTIVKGV